MGQQTRGFTRTSFMVSILIIFLCISIQIIFGFTYFITDEDIITHNGKPSYNLALSGKRDDFTLRQDNDYEDDTDHLTFGVSQYDGAPQEENPVRDLLAGYDNLFPTEFEDLLGLSRKFQVGYRMIKVGKRKNSIIGTSQWGRRKRSSSVYLVKILQTEENLKLKTKKIIWNPYSLTD